MLPQQDVVCAGFRVRRRVNLQSAFSLIELVVAIGVMMILIALTLPALGRSRDRALQLGDEVQARSLAQLVSLYASTQRDYFPTVERAPFAAQGVNWGLPMQKAGLLNSANETSSRLPLLFTEVAFVDPAVVRPGLVPPADEVKVQTQKISQVQFPSAKGMLWPVRRDDQPLELTWCCSFSPPLGAIAFMDGSVSLSRWTEFVGPEGKTKEFWAGLPIISTWDGVNGRDRR